MFGERDHSEICESKKEEFENSIAVDELDNSRTVGRLRSQDSSSDASQLFSTAREVTDELDHRTIGSVLSPDSQLLKNCKHVFECKVLINRCDNVLLNTPISKENNQVDLTSSIEKVIQSLNANKPLTNYIFREKQTNSASLKEIQKKFDLLRALHLKSVDERETTENEQLNSVLDREGSIENEFSEECEQEKDPNEQTDCCNTGISLQKKSLTRTRLKSNHRSVVNKSMKPVGSSILSTDKETGTSQQKDNPNQSTTNQDSQIGWGNTYPVDKETIKHKNHPDQTDKVISNHDSLTGWGNTFTLNNETTIIQQNPVPDQTNDDSDEDDDNMEENTQLVWERILSSKLTEDCSNSNLNVNNEEKDGSNSNLNVNNEKKDGSNSNLNVNNEKKDGSNSNLNVNNEEKDGSNSNLNVNNEEKDGSNSNLNVNNEEKDGSNSNLNVNNEKKDGSNSNLNVNNKKKNGSNSNLNVNNEKKDCSNSNLNVNNEETSSLKQTSESVSSVIEDKLKTNYASKLSTENEKKLLDFICYRSYELIDFKNDEVWKQIASKNDFKEELWMHYKHNFFNNLVTNSKLYPDLCNFFIQTYKEKGIGNKNATMTSLPLPNRGENIYPLPSCSKQPLSNSQYCKKVQRNSVQDDSDDSTISNNSPRITRSQYNKSKLSTSNSQNRKRSSYTKQANDSDESSVFSYISRRIDQKRNSQPDRSGPCTSTDQIRKKMNNTKEKIASSNRSRNIDDDSNNPFRKSTDYEFSSDSSDEKLVINEILTQPNKIRIVSESDSEKSSSDSVINSNQCIPARFPVQNCSNFSTTKKRADSTIYKKPRSNFVSYERLAMLKYIQAQTNSIYTIKGNTFWKEMEASNACPGRTWHSLRNHFFKSLIHDIDSFDLNEKFLRKLKRICKKH